MTEPPPVAVLFKGKHKGTIWKELNEDPDKPQWMLIQTQENGSYRSEDMYDLLGHNLKQVEDPSEACVVLLDWYAGHRTPEIADLIASRGHVLLLHGGGTTAYEQVNDTHLHATLQQKIKAIESLVFYGQLESNRQAVMNPQLVRHIPVLRGFGIP